MYKRNPERLARIKKLRAQGFSLDQIVATTGDPRSTVGYYLTKHCGGRIRTRAPSSALPVQPETSTIIRDSKVDRVEEYMRQLERKEGLSLPQGKRAGNPFLETMIEEMFLRDPETLRVRLLLLENLIRLQPFLRIRLDSMPLIQLYLAENRNLGRSAGA